MNLYRDGRFINQDNVNEMGGLLSLAKELELDKRCKMMGGEFVMSAHQGSCDGENRRLYNIRLTEDGVKKIPKELMDSSIKHFNCNNTQDFLGKTECELYKGLVVESSVSNLVSDTPVFFINADFDVYPNLSETSPWFCLGNLQTDGIDIVMDNYVNNKSIAQNIRATVLI